MVMEYKEYKTLILERVPPGDRWTQVNGDGTIFGTLTEGLEFWYQKTKCREFHLAALEGKIYSVSKEETIPEEPKQYSLYGE
jgi:hypothetical protein|tara:strand:+ start:951 stop:1196 length:246 start_codon:yes stop_codon:yes gene_type:complete